MPLEQKITAIIIAVSIFFLIIELVRRRKLREEYSWLWLLTGTILLVLTLEYQLLVWITGLIGAAAPTSTLFFLLLYFSFLSAYSSQ